MAALGVLEDVPSADEPGTAERPQQLDSFWWNRVGAKQVEQQVCGVRERAGERDAGNRTPGGRGRGGGTQSDDHSRGEAVRHRPMDAEKEIQIRSGCKRAANS